MSEKLNVRFWDVPSAADFEYPELKDQELAYAPTVDRFNAKSCGIAFSGGGTVSAALAPGFIKAIEELGLMGNVAYISGVSGGTWGTAAYCYAPGPEQRDNYFKDVLTSVKNLSFKDADAPTTVGSMVHACTDARIGDLTINNHHAGPHNAFTDAVGQIFLAPFQLYGNEKMYFTTDQKALNNIISRNPALSEDNFIKLYQELLGDEKNRPSSPYFIMNTSMLTPKASDEVHPQNTYPFEFTPLYTGMKGAQPKSDGQSIGAMFTETYGFDTLNPKITDMTGSDQGIMNVDMPEVPFDLSHPVGTSGSAVEEKVASAFPSGHKNPLLNYLPAFNYWNANDEDVSQTNLYLFGDGGIAEDTGLSPLLARKVENIVLFITEPFDVNAISNRTCEIEQRHFGYNQIATLFGAEKYVKVKHKHEIVHLGKPKYTKTSDYEKTHQFFDEADFAKLQAKLVAAKGKKGPITVQTQFTIKQNDRFGVEGGWSPTITWVIVDTCDGFNEQLGDTLYDKKTQKFHHEQLNNFPAICTFKQNWNITEHLLIQLTNAQSRLLASQAYWMVQNSPEVKAGLNGEFLG